MIVCATPHSNNRRVSLYQEAFGGERVTHLRFRRAPTSKWNPNAPSVGTQGAIWLVLFSHGFPGVFLFAGLFIWILWRFRGAGDPLGFWVHVMLLILIVQLAGVRHHPDADPHRDDRHRIGDA